MILRRNNNVYARTFVINDRAKEKVDKMTLFFALIFMIPSVNSAQAQLE